MSQAVQQVQLGGLNPRGSVQLQKRAFFNQQEDNFIIQFSNIDEDAASNK